MSLLKLLQEQTARDDSTIPIREDDVPGSQSLEPDYALYAATNLESWETDIPHGYARDDRIDGVCFRRLDPDYYAWLRHKMDLAKKAADSGRITPEAFDELRDRFNVIHFWAIDHLGEEALRHAVETLDPKGYSPPQIKPTNGLPTKAPPAPKSAAPAAPRYLFPPDGHWNFTQRVRPSALTKVDAIRDLALSLGWSEARLYQNRGRYSFPCGQEYGLVCFLHDDRSIGEVTRQSIEIIGPPPQENSLRFYNPDVDQPWLKKTVSAP